MANEDNPNFNNPEDVGYILLNRTEEPDPTGNVIVEEANVVFASVAQGVDREMARREAAALNYVREQSHVEETPVYAEAARELLARQIRERLQGIAGENINSPEVRARVTREVTNLLMSLPGAADPSPVFRTELNGTFPPASDYEPTVPGRPHGPPRAALEAHRNHPLPSAIAPERPQPNVPSPEEGSTMASRFVPSGTLTGPFRAMTPEEVEELRNVVTVDIPKLGRVDYTSLNLTRTIHVDHAAYERVTTSHHSEVSMGARVPHRPCPLCGEAEPHEHHRDSLVASVTREDIQRLGAQVRNQPLVSVDLVVARQLLERNEAGAINLSGALQAQGVHMVQTMNGPVFQQGPSPIIREDLVHARQVLERNQELAIANVQAAQDKELAQARPYADALNENVDVVMRVAQPAAGGPMTMQQLQGRTLRTELPSPPATLVNYAAADAEFTNRAHTRPLGHLGLDMNGNEQGEEGPPSWTGLDCQTCGMEGADGHSQEACDAEILRGEDAVGIPREHQSAASNRARDREEGLYHVQRGEREPLTAPPLSQIFFTETKYERQPTGRIVLNQYRGRNIRVEIRETVNPEFPLWDASTSDVVSHLRAWLDDAILENPPYLVQLHVAHFEQVRRHLIERGQTDGFDSFTISEGPPINPQPLPTAPLDAALAFRTLKWPTEDSYEEPSAVKPTEEEAHIKQAEYDLNQQGLRRSTVSTFGDRRPPNLGRLRSKKATGKPELNLDLIIEIRRRRDSEYWEAGAYGRGLAEWRSYSSALAGPLTLTAFDAWTVWREEIHQALKHLTREQRTGAEGSYILTNTIHILERRAAELQLEE